MSTSKKITIVEATKKATSIYPGRYTVRDIVTSTSGSRAGKQFYRLNGFGSLYSPDMLKVVKTIAI